jgi:hypothetical protein
MTYRGTPLDGESPTITVTFTEEEWEDMSRQSQAADARIKAEMAACPYVACECGYHYPDED